MRFFMHMRSHYLFGENWLYGQLIDHSSEVVRNNSQTTSECFGVWSNYLRYSVGLSGANFFLAFFLQVRDHYDFTFADSVPIFF